MKSEYVYGKNISGLNIIGGEASAAMSGDTFSSINASDHRDIVGEFPKSSIEDIRHACQVAREAQTKWKNIPAPKRGETLMHFATLLRRNKERLAEVELKETALSEKLEKKKGTKKYDVLIFTQKILDKLEKIPSKFKEIINKRKEYKIKK